MDRVRVGLLVEDAGVVEGVFGCLELGCAHLSEEERERLLNADPNLLLTAAEDTR